VSYVIAAYGITALTLGVYALHLFRTRAKERKTLARTQESNNG
jgi:heme exporter protein CcmD